MVKTMVKHGFNAGGANSKAKAYLYLVQLETVSWDTGSCGDSATFSPTFKHRNPDGTIFDPENP